MILRKYAAIFLWPFSSAIFSGKGDLFLYASNAARPADVPNTNRMNFSSPIRAAVKSKRRNISTDCSCLPSCESPIKSVLSNVKFQDFVKY